MTFFAFVPNTLSNMPSHLGLKVKDLDLDLITPNILLLGRANN